MIALEHSYNKVVGGNIRSLRESKGISLRRLSYELFISYPTLSRMENGDQKIDMDFLVKIADYFGVTVNHLISREDIEGSATNQFGSTEKVEDLSAFEKLKYILDNYLQAKQEVFKGHFMGDHVRNITTSTIINEVGLNEKYFVVGSIGQGQWAEVPWISVFLKSITTTATKGYYIVYLFKSDMSGFYVSLNQGYTYFKDKYGTKVGREKILRTASLIRDQLNTVPDYLMETDIDLVSRGDLGRGYENGHIYGRYYDLQSFISSQEIIRDLRSLLIAYNEIESLIGKRSISQFNDYLLLEDDGQYLDDSKQEIQYQEKVNDLAKGNTKVFEEEDGPSKRPDPTVDKSEKKRWSRNANVAAEALRLADYKCAYDENHTTFISKKTGKPFMESHHLVLMNLQSEFENDLDRIANLLSLCPTCHRAIHHGVDKLKEEMLKKLFYERRDKLESVGIEITFSDLFKSY
ncbi:MrcB family domain-containing protein [Chengkuizengella axinellae]|uniref:DUF3578 domain-containing protein n=1 Tax=Chengkuizengella axinellae TaxID=3064388 RepID=A0ABT9J3H5_9BACL|nr:DUF3578 domain-containing protein [Chengkuizengella sp. 2205SS18-9]MDP5276172.1 DUF3578 domain-containing protein [Chengkuizengella sp. 2205SS18-9]